MDEVATTSGLVPLASDVSHYFIDYRARRFRQRFYAGIDAHQGQTARWFVLTESDKAIALKLNITQKFNELVRHLRRHYGTFEYCWVRHRQGDKKRINVHVVYFGGFIPQAAIEKWWWKNYKSHRSKMGVVKNVKTQAWYLSKHLNNHEFERECFSHNWVFPGWVGFSMWFKKEWGTYPPRKMLSDLAGMPKETRKSNVWYGLYLESKK